jgi:hypothetical protein
VAVLGQLAPERRVKGHPPGTSLRVGDEHDAATKIDIANSQAKRLAEPKPGAVEQQEQGAVQRAGVTAKSSDET